MKKKILTLIILLILTTFAFGCSSDEIEAALEDGVNVLENDGEYDFEFTDRDLDINYDEESATIIELSDEDIDINGSGADYEDSLVTISAEGTYILRGELNNGQILIDAAEEDKIQIVLDNVSINNDDGAAIYVKQADKVFITMSEDSENSLSCNGDIEDDGDTNVDAVVFSKDDLTINGEGSLTISTEYGNGISSKDDLVITSGTYKINVSGRCLEANDRIKIAEGFFMLISGDDGLHCENDEEDTLGYIYIQGGTFDIFAEDDGIHGNLNVTINGGEIVIEDSYEGIEGTTIDLNGGEIYVNSDDDGLNAAGGNDGSNANGPGADMFSADGDAYISITGGSININADGDGIDSNGSLYISGGTTYVSGPTNNGNGALDYNGEAIITGGTVIAAGSSGMSQNFSQGSSQGSMLIYSNGEISGEIDLLDASGNVLASFTPEKMYSSVVISTPDVLEDETYYVNMGITSQTVTMEDLIYGGGGMMNPGGKQRP